MYSKCTFQNILSLTERVATGQVVMATIHAARNQLDHALQIIEIRSLHATTQVKFVLKADWMKLMKPQSSCLPAD
jgi:hypothetical protein